MSPPISSGLMSSGTDTPPNSNIGIQWVNQPMPTTHLPIADVNPKPESANINFQPPVVTNQNNMFIHHFVHHYVPTQAPYFQGNYGANYNSNFPGFGATNVTNWLQGNPQPGFANFSSVRFPPPIHPSAPPTNPFSYPGNAYPNILHGFNYIADQQNLLGNGPFVRPRANSVNICRPRAQAPSTSHLDIGASVASSLTLIQENAPPETVSTAQVSPLRTNLLVPKEKPNQDQPSQNQRTRKQLQDKHKCHICNKSFESGKALGGHMSSHERKRKRDKEVGTNFMTSASTAINGASTSRRRANHTEERDEFDATNDKDEEN